MTIDNNYCTFEEKKNNMIDFIINGLSTIGFANSIFNKKEDTFIDYVCRKFIFDEFQTILFTGVCGIVKARGKFTMEDLGQIQELGIPLGQIDGFNLSGFRERTSPVSYDTFVTYLVNICDNKFTKEQIKQTIEND